MLAPLNALLAVIVADPYVIVITCKKCYLYACLHIARTLAYIYMPSLLPFTV